MQAIPGISGQAAIELAGEPRRSHAPDIRRMSATARKPP